MEGDSDTIVWYVISRRKKIGLAILVCLLLIVIGIVMKTYFSRQEKKEQRRMPTLTEKQQTANEEVIQGTERAVEIKAISLQSYLKNGDAIDVRIQYPNGEEYVVVSKRCCHDLIKEEGSVTLYLTEEEILRLSSSMVDCVQMDGRLYTARYLREMEESASIATYIPSTQVQQLIKSNPNIVGEAESILVKQNRKQLEKRALSYEMEEKDGNNVQQTNKIYEEFEEQKIENEVSYID